MRWSAIGSHGAAALGRLHRLRAPVDVVAGAERAPGAAQADDAHRVVGLGAVQRGLEILDQLGDDRVQALGRLSVSVATAPSRS